MKTVKETAEEFFELPIGITEDLIQDLADALGHLFQDYISFAASCGTQEFLFRIISLVKIVDLFS